MKVFDTERLLALANKFDNARYPKLKHGINPWISVEEMDLARDTLRIAAKPVDEMVREATIEECAAIAKAHKGSYRKKSNYKQFYKGASSEARLEIQAEERGEDIASEVIERTIRALSTTGEPKP